MLRSVKELHGYNVFATDGDFGKVHEFLFDDQSWTIRHLVIDTGNWLPGRKILITPDQLDKPEWSDKQFPVKLNKKQIENSPPIEEDEPVSRQHEEALSKYFDMRPYWTGGVMGGAYVAPTNVGDQSGTSVRANQKKGAVAEEEKPKDPNLRSTKEVREYTIEASDGDIGHLEDFIVDDDTWIIRYIVVETKNWLPGKKVLVPIPAIKTINWAEVHVRLDMTRQQIKDSPEYDPAQPINREQEEVLYDFHGRPRYWETH